MLKTLSTLLLTLILLVCAGGIAAAQKVTRPFNFNDTATANIDPCLSQIVLTQEIDPITCCITFTLTIPPCIGSLGFQFHLPQDTIQSTPDVIFLYEDTLSDSRITKNTILYGGNKLTFTICPFQGDSIFWCIDLYYLSSPTKYSFRYTNTFNDSCVHVCREIWIKCCEEYDVSKQYYIVRNCCDDTPLDCDCDDPDPDPDPNPIPCLEQVEVNVVPDETDPCCAIVTITNPACDSFSYIFHLFECANMSNNIHSDSAFYITEKTITDTICVEDNINLCYHIKYAIPSDYKTINTNDSTHLWIDLTTCVPFIDTNQIPSDTSKICCEGEEYINPHKIEWVHPGYEPPCDECIRKIYPEIGAIGWIGGDAGAGHYGYWNGDDWIPCDSCPIECECPDSTKFPLANYYDKDSCHLFYDFYCGKEYDCEIIWEVIIFENLFYLDKNGNSVFVVEQIPVSIEGDDCDDFFCSIMFSSTKDRLKQMPPLRAHYSSNAKVMTPGGDVKLEDLFDENRLKKLLNCEDDD